MVNIDFRAAGKENPINGASILITQNFFVAKYLFSSSQLQNQYIFLTLKSLPMEFCVTSLLGGNLILKSELWVFNGNFYENKRKTKIHTLQGQESRHREHTNNSREIFMDFSEEKSIVGVAKHAKCKLDLECGLKSNGWMSYGI